MSFVERFRMWYEYERDCNAKTLAMLESVPADKRASPVFGRAVGKMAHLVAARHFWLYRLRECADRPESWFPEATLEQLPSAVAEVERRWTAYLGKLTEADVMSECTLVREDGRQYRWRLVDLLTQVFGHAWYHRGQIAMIVHDLGGKAVDTDFIFWSGPRAVD